MAKETITRLIDDIDGGEANETVKFMIDGHMYEIDLSAKNANKLRNALAPYVEHGTRVRSSTIPRNGSRPRTGNSAAERELRETMRRWLREHGYQVGNRGRISDEHVKAYEDQTPAPDWKPSRSKGKAE